MSLPLGAVHFVSRYVPRQEHEKLAMHGISARLRLLVCHYRVAQVDVENLPLS